MRYQLQGDAFEQHTFPADRAAIVVVFNSAGEALYEFRECEEGQFCFWFGRRLVNGEATLQAALLWFSRFLPTKRGPAVSSDSVLTGERGRSAEVILSSP